MFFDVYLDLRRFIAAKPPKPARSSRLDAGKGTTSNAKFPISKALSVEVKVAFVNNEPLHNPISSLSTKSFQLHDITVFSFKACSFLLYFHLKSALHKMTQLQAFYPLPIEIYRNNFQPD